MYVVSFVDLSAAIKSQVLRVFESLYFEIKEPPVLLLGFVCYALMMAQFDIE